MCNVNSDMKLWCERYNVTDKWLHKNVGPDPMLRDLATMAWGNHTQLYEGREDVFPPLEFVDPTGNPVVTFYRDSESTSTVQLGVGENLPTYMARITGILLDFTQKDAWPRWGLKISSNKKSRTQLIRMVYEILDAGPFLAYRRFSAPTVGDASRLWNMDHDTRFLVAMKLPSLLDLYSMCNSNTDVKLWCEQNNVAQAWINRNIGRNAMRREVATLMFEDNHWSGFMEMLDKTGAQILYINKPQYDDDDDVLEDLIIITITGLRYSNPGTPLDLRLQNILRTYAKENMIKATATTHSNLYYTMDIPTRTTFIRMFYELLDEGVFYRYIHPTSGTTYLVRSCVAPGCTNDAVAVCETCRIDAYCGPKCQRADYNTHRQTCSTEKGK